MIKYLLAGLLPTSVLLSPMLYTFVMGGALVDSLYVYGLIFYSAERFVSTVFFLN